MMNTSNNGLTVYEASRASGISRVQLYSLLQGGKIAARKVGFQWFIDRKALLAYCAQRKRVAK